MLLFLLLLILLLHDDPKGGGAGDRPQKWRCGTGRSGAAPRAQLHQEVGMSTTFPPQTRQRGVPNRRRDPDDLGRQRIATIARPCSPPAPARRRRGYPSRVTPLPAFDPRGPPTARGALPDGGLLARGPAEAAFSNQMPVISHPRTERALPRLLGLVAHDAHDARAPRTEAAFSAAVSAAFSLPTA